MNRRSFVASCLALVAVPFAKRKATLPRITTVRASQLSDALKAIRPVARRMSISEEETTALLKSLAST